jgi:hypothetical protein
MKTREWTPEERAAKAAGLTCLSKNGRIWKWGMADSDGWPGNDDTGWHWVDWCVDPTEALRKLEARK